VQQGSIESRSRSPAACERSYAPTASERSYATSFWTTGLTHALKKCWCFRIEQQVKKYIELASQNIQFDVTLAEACFEDRQKFCKAVPPVCHGWEEVVHGSSWMFLIVPSLRSCSLTDANFKCLGGVRLAQGSARVIRCLSKKREQLSPVCRVTLFDEEVSHEAVAVGKGALNRAPVAGQYPCFRGIVWSVDLVAA
jgi:hypothetical protein